jgi:hypothetical protein
VRNTGLLPSRGLQELLDEKYGARTSTANKRSKFCIVFSSMRRASNSCISDQHNEPILNDATHVERELLRSLCRRKIGCDGACAAAVALDLIAASLAARPL